jgi:hypothetical protein
MAASGELGYRSRASRCEGLLQLFVANSDGIDLLGYLAAPVDFKAIAGRSVRLLVLGAAPRDNITLRALSVTQRTRYQMDRTDVHPEETVEWNGDVLAKAVKPPGAAPLDPAKLGVLACSARCNDQPDTVYWPVLIEPRPPGRLALALVFRAGVRAANVTIQLEDDQGHHIELPTGLLVLQPDAVTVVPLPASLAPGTYRLVADARDTDSRAPVGTFAGRIVVPMETR